MSPMVETEAGRAFRVPGAPDVGEPTGQERVFEKKTGKVVVTKHEHGWKIVGGSTILWDRNGEPWMGFTAEIRVCDDHGEYKNRPICTTVHREMADETWTKHKLSYCHELGHPERIKALAENLLRTY